MHKSNYFWALGIVAAWLLVCPGRVHAYLDPGTGSYLFQILIAALVGGLFAVKLFWGRIKAFFLGLFGKKTVGPAEEKGDGSSDRPE